MGNVQPQKLARSHPHSLAGLGCVSTHAATEAAVPPWAHRVFTHPQEQPLPDAWQRQTPSQLSTGALRAAPACRGWRQLQLRPRLAIAEHHWLLQSVFLELAQPWRNSGSRKTWSSAALTLLMCTDLSQRPPKCCSRGCSE